MTANAIDDGKRLAREQVDATYFPRTYTAAEVQRMVAEAYAKGRKDQDTLHNRRCGK